MRFARLVKRLGVGGLNPLFEIVPLPHADLMGIGASR